MSDLNRRAFIHATAAVSLLAVASDSFAGGEKLSANKAFDYQHSPVPLPFDPKKLSGLSEKLLQSHWENNYGGAVKALNAVRGRLKDAANDASVPPYLYNDLKREHLMRTGSVVLHELYFANLGGGGKAGADVRTKIANSFGTFDAWESEFRKIANGLGGGSGWVVLGYNSHLKLLENYWMADHTTYPAYSTPILVLDMYEHAYHIDYGAAAAKYIDAFFANINWEAVVSRV